MRTMVSGHTPNDQTTVERLEQPRPTQPPGTTTCLPTCCCRCWPRLLHTCCVCFSFLFFFETQSKKGAQEHVCAMCTGNRGADVLLPTRTTDDATWWVRLWGVKGGQGGAIYVAVLFFLLSLFFCFLLDSPSSRSEGGISSVVGCIQDFERVEPSESSVVPCSPDMTNWTSANVDMSFRWLEMDWLACFHLAWLASESFSRAGAWYGDKSFKECPTTSQWSMECRTRSTAK